jgi:type IV fimbrial biogenesis protein FimT
MRQQRGFTLIEMMVGLAILAILMAIAVPNMTSWMTTTKAVSAAEFYVDGLKQARAEAVKRNAVTRLVLARNARSGQFDWQIDLCVPTSLAPCGAGAGTWSTPTATNGNANAADFKSIVRTAENLPGTGQMTLTTSPANASTVYFTPLGWVDTNVATRLTRIALAPVVADAFPASAVVVTLAGVVTKCNPSVASTDSRSCPP